MDSIDGHIEVPVTFQYRGREYRGVLSSVSGLGTPGHYLNLMVQNYYWGQLQFLDTGEWRFHGGPGREDLGHLAREFGERVIQWVQ